MCFVQGSIGRKEDAEEGQLKEVNEAKVNVKLQGRGDGITKETHEDEEKRHEFLYKRT